MSLWAIGVVPGDRGAFLRGVDDGRDGLEGRAVELDRGESDVPS